MSQINYTGINENFPVAGQDNDTQTFRDNFDTIKTSLRIAQEEVTALETSAARTNADNDFENKFIERAVFRNNWDYRKDFGPQPSNLNIDFENGPYQIYTFTGSVDVEFTNFPTNTNPLLAQGVGKITLELYSDGAQTITFKTSGGTVFKSNGFDGSFPSLTLNSADNPVIIEVWQHNTDIIYIKNVGTFS